VAISYHINIPYTANSLELLNNVSWSEKSSSSKSQSLGSSGTIVDYDYAFSFFFINFKRKPVILVSSQAITSALKTASSCL